MGRSGCSSVVFDSTNRSLECGCATIGDGVVVVETAPMEPVDDGLDVDMDLIRRARALRGASQLARTESK